MTVFYVSPQGSDTTGDGSEGNPFATPMHAVAQTPLGAVSTVRIADGTYSGQVNAAYYKFVQLIGNAGAPGNVVISDGLWAQDHATLTITGLATPSVSSRQFAIVDLSGVHFLTNSQGVHVAANEMSKINYLSGVQILGSAVVHCAADLNSVALLSADITVPNPIGVMYFAEATRGGIIQFGPRNSTGIFGLGISQSGGNRYYADDASRVYVPSDLYWGSLI